MVLLFQALAQKMLIKFWLSETNMFSQQHPKSLSSEAIAQTVVLYVSKRQLYLCKGMEEQNCRTIAKHNMEIQASA